MIARNGKPRARLVSLAAPKQRRAPGRGAGKWRMSPRRLQRAVAARSPRPPSRAGGRDAAAARHGSPDLVGCQRQTTRRVRRVPGFATPDAAYASAASALEISIKAGTGKLRTSRRPSEAVADSDFRTLPVTFEHAEAVLTVARTPSGSHSIESHRGRCAGGKARGRQQRQPIAHGRCPARSHAQAISRRCRGLKVALCAARPFDRGRRIQLAVQR